MIRGRSRTLVLASTFVLGVAAGAIACSSSDGDPTPDVDAGDDGSSRPDREGGGDASDAAPDVLVDASAPAVSCSVAPCVVEIAAGFDSACARLENGTVRCWGSNGGGELGRGPDAGASANTPAPVVGLNDATQISGSGSLPSDIYCARRAAGAAVCWGSNTNGVLGRIVGGSVSTESSPDIMPVSGLGPVTGVFAGYRVSCATLAGNDVACWGSNTGGQIPKESLEEGALFAPTTFALAGASKYLAIADRGTVALVETGLVSWGLAGALFGPDTGVLGREVSTVSALPATVDLAHVSAVAASAGYACAISNGQVFCWGDGPTAGSDAIYPSRAGVGTTATYAQTIAVGPRSACATMSDGTATCWGDNTRGQLGVGNVESQPTPVRVAKLAGIPVRMALMESASCALLSTGAVQCWGLNDKGQLGTGTADTVPHIEPQTVMLTP